MRIGAAIVARDMEATIGATIQSLEWADGVYLLDDNSTDQTVAAAKRAASIPVIVERSPFEDTLFDRDECRVRNYAIDRAFAELKSDYLVSIDADELLSELLKSHIVNMEKCKQTTLSMTIWHLFDRERYLHFWETRQGGISMIDPHTRVFSRGFHFEDIFPDRKHPAVKAGRDTRFLHGPHHFHLKYFRSSPYRNKCLKFLPPEWDEGDARPYLRRLPFDLPLDIRGSLDRIGW